MHARALETVRDAFAVVWRETASITLTITESDIRWHGRGYLEEPDRTSDSIPWMFFKDGLRELAFRRGFESHELLTLLTLMQKARLTSADDDDLLTLLWEHDFTYMQYKFTELGMLMGAALEAGRGEMRDKIASPTEVESEAHLLASSSITKMDDYDSTLTSSTIPRSST